MNEEIIVGRAIDRYKRLDEIIRSRMLKDEEVAFIQGRKLELMLLIHALDEQAISRLAESLADTEPEMVNISGPGEVNLN